MLSPTLITLAFLFLCENIPLILSVTGFFCNTSCSEVWQNTSPGDWMSSSSLVGIPIMILHDKSLTFTNIFFNPQSGVLLPYFFLLHFSEFFCILFEFCLFISLIVSRIVTFLSTLIAGIVVKVSLGFILLIFCFTFIISSFPTLRSHKLISDAVGLVLPVRIIFRLLI